MCKMCSVVYDLKESIFNGVYFAVNTVLSEKKEKK